jgi:hypothetical protein
MPFFTAEIFKGYFEIKRGWFLHEDREKKQEINHKEKEGRKGHISFSGHNS